MRSINHAITGALIGLTINDAAISVPVSFGSHYVLDAVPHFDFKKGSKEIGLTKFNILLIIDGILSILLVAIIAIFRPHHWPVAIVCAFLASSPDLFNLNRYIRTLKKQSWHPNIYSRLAKKIQWFERPIGAVVEIVWLTAASILLAIYLANPHT